MSSSRRPEKSEYFEYYDAYVKLVPEGEITTILEQERQHTLELLKGVTAERAEYRYAPGKWSLKEVLGHVVDMEWVFTYRALSFARGNPAPLPGVDQDAFLANGNLATRDLQDVLTEFSHLRNADTRLFASLDDATLDRRGTASGYEFSVRALLYIIAGHQIHHLRVLRDRYLPD